MSFDKPWYIEQQDIIDKQSTVSTEDISKTAKKESDAHKIRQEAINIKQKEEIEAETSINQALWEEDTPVNWEDNEISIRESGIDFKSKIAQIDVKIVQIQTKINIIEQKNDLSDKDFDNIDLLDKELKKLTAEKLAIIDNRIENKKEIVAIIDNRIDNKKEQLSIKWKEILDRTNKMKSFIDTLPDSIHKEKLSGLIDEMNSFDNDEDISKKEREISGLLKNPWILLSIAKDFGWVDTQEYKNFKTSAIAFDETLVPYFEDIEKIEVGGAFGMDDLVGASVVEWSEKNEFWTMVDMDLKWDGDVLMRHRVWGWEYGFEVKIEQSELDEIMKENAVQIEYLKSWVKNINSFGVWFEELKFELWKNWNSPDFISEIPYMLQKFPTDIFDELEQNYSDLKLDSSSLITKSDIDSLLDVDNREELWPKIIAINEKIKNTQEALQDKETKVVSEYTEGFRALAKEKMKNKEQEADTLKFLHSIGFDMFANSDVDWIIRQINISKWRFGISEDIDLEKWNLGTVYGWENNVERKNFARIVNILFSGAEDEPIDLSSIWAMWSPVFNVGWEVKDYGEFMTGIREQVGKTRPVLVLQTDMLNHIGHTTVIILPLTTQCIANAYPLRFPIHKREQLKHTSDLLCDQLRAIDINRLLPTKIASLSKDEMLSVEAQVQIVLGFE